MRSPVWRARRLRALCRLGQVILLPALVVACLAVVLGLNTTRDALRSAQVSLKDAEAPITDLAVMTDRLRGMSQTLSTSLTDSASTIETLSNLTATVSQVVDIVAPLLGSVRQASTNLHDSQARFDALHASTLATQADLVTAQADLDRAAAASAKLPAVMRDARTALAAQDHRLGQLMIVACAAIVLFALVLALLLEAVAGTARLAATATTPSCPAE
jgi:hypothetical protein